MSQSYNPYWQEWGFAVQRTLIKEAGLSWLEFCKVEDRGKRSCSVSWEWKTPPHIQKELVPTQTSKDLMVRGQMLSLKKYTESALYWLARRGGIINWKERLFFGFFFTWVSCVDWFISSWITSRCYVGNQ